MNKPINALNTYCEKHSTLPSELLQELDRETHLKTLAPQMLSGHLQGQFLRLISLLTQPKAILEIGTFTGYAAICLAEGLAEGGALHTIEANEELEYLIRNYIEKARMQEKIQLHIGDALALIPELAGPFDLVFIDAGKREYIDFYNLVLEKVAPGGLIIADNVLWSGKVLEEAEDEDTQTLQAFNKMVQEDVRVENLMLPLRDGLLLIRKL